MLDASLEDSGKNTMGRLASEIASVKRTIGSRADRKWNRAYNVPIFNLVFSNINACDSCLQRLRRTGKLFVVDEDAHRKGRDPKWI
jgi:hypothetical protein